MQRTIYPLVVLFLLAFNLNAQQVEYHHDRLLPAENLVPFFQQASEEFQVPVEILMGVGYVESHWRQRIPDEGDRHMPPSFGVMGLRNDAHFGYSLEKAAHLIHQPVSTLKDNTFQNIRGAAAYLNLLAHTVDVADRPNEDLASWDKVLEKYSGISQPDISPIYGDQIFDILIKGCQSVHIQIPAKPINRHSSSGEQPSPGHGNSQHPSTPDYPSAFWVPASTSNYTSSSRTTSYPINLIVMHDMEGSYASSISWFQDPSAAACAHYLIRSSDGQVTQMVQEKDVAWHCGNWDYNTRSIGIEQEGYYNDPSYYTSNLYTSAASLCAYICNKYSIPKTRQYIIGHDQVPDPNDSTLWGGANQHQDPGGFYKWRTLIELTSGVASTFTPVKVTANSLNVRCEPRATSPILTTLAVNQEFVQYGTATNGWALIFITGKNSEHYDGWSSNVYLTADNCAPQIETQNSWPSTLSVYSNAASSTSGVDAVTDGQRFVATGTPVTGYDGNTAWRNFYTPASATVANGWCSGANLNYITGGNVTPALSISTPNTSVCANQSITFTSTPTNGGSSPTYQWYVGGVASGTGSSLTLNNVSANTSVYCVLTSNASCLSTTTGQSNQVNITITSAPTISLSATDNSICSVGNGTSITASGNATSYSWSSGLGSAATVSVSPTSTTTYNVTASSGANCSATATITITVTETPNITVSSANNSICSGASTTVSVTGNASGYTWSNGLGSRQSFTVNPSNTSEYDVTASNGNCSATGAVTVNVTQTPVISVNPVSTSICTGGAGTSLTITGTAASYNWSNGLGTSQTVTANPTSTTTYTVTASNGNCSATSSATVNVSNLPTASISPGNASVCPGNSIPISAYPNGTAYTWSGPGNYTGSQQSANISATGLYSVTITNPGGCAGSATASIEVSPGVSPTVNAGNNVSIQSGQQTQLNAIATGGVGPYSYLWSPATGLNADTLNNPVASPTVTTTYVVTVTGANGCITTGQVIVTVQGAACDTSISPTVIINGNQLAAGYIANASYQWQLNGQNIPDTGRYVTANSQGNYSVVVTIGSCTYYSNNQLFTSIADLGLRKLSIAPNPSNGLFTLSFETEKAENISFKIFDALGRVVQENAVVKIEGVYTHQINLINAVKGVYMLQINSGSNSSSLRLVVN